MGKAAEMRGWISRLAILLGCFARRTLECLAGRTLTTVEEAIHLAGMGPDYSESSDAV